MHDITSMFWYMQLFHTLYIWWPAIVFNTRQITEVVSRFLKFYDVWWVAHGFSSYYLQLYIVQIIWAVHVFENTTFVCVWILCHCCSCGLHNIPCWFCLNFDLLCVIFYSTLFSGNELKCWSSPEQLPWYHSYRLTVAVVVPASLWVVLFYLHHLK